MTLPDRWKKFLETVPPERQPEVLDLLILMRLRYEDSKVKTEALPRLSFLKGKPGSRAELKKAVKLL